MLEAAHVEVDQRAGQGGHYGVGQHRRLDVAHLPSLDRQPVERQRRQGGADTLA